MPVRTPHEQKALDAHTTPGLPPILLMEEIGLEADRGPLLDQPAPVARLGRGRQVALAEGLDVIIGDALRVVVVAEQPLHLGVEIGPIPLDLDEVLLGA